MPFLYLLMWLPSGRIILRSCCMVLLRQHLSVAKSSGIQQSRPDGGFFGCIASLFEDDDWMNVHLERLMKRSTCKGPATSRNDAVSICPFSIIVILQVLLSTT